MFHPLVVESSTQKLWDNWKPGFLPRELSISEADDLTKRLAKHIDEKGNIVKEITAEEAKLITNERLMVKASFKYTAERYLIINREGAGLGRMFPLLESQQFILDRIADKELEIHEHKVSDGILVNLLKGARQIGGSTLAEAIGAYKFTQQNHLFGVIAADEPGTSAYIFDMFERFVENMPWWLKPIEVEHVKNSEILFDNDSHIWVGAGKSTRGTEGKRGQLGRGRTISFGHLSELSSWDAAEQIDDAFMWSLPRSWRTFVLFESTAKGRHNWWHEHWEVSKTGKGRFFCIFIPWYAEPGKYGIPAPVDWSPTPHTIAHAARCEESSTKWMKRRITLTRDQLYWYESTREYYEAKDELQKFIEEVGAVDDDETFQHSGRSIFPGPTIQRIRESARPIAAVLEVGPWADLKPRLSPN